MKSICSFHLHKTARPPSGTISTLLLSTLLHLRTICLPKIVSVLERGGSLIMPDRGGAWRSWWDVKAGTDYRTCSATQPLWQPRTWCSRVWEKMLVAQTAAAAGLNQHSAAKNAFVFLLKTDNFWFVPRQYSSASEHIHSMFAACLLTVQTNKHHVLGCRVMLCRGICSIVCTGLKETQFMLWLYLTDARRHCVVGLLPN